MKFNKYKTVYITVLLTCILSACSKIDDYRKEYMSNGSIIYTGKMDSVHVLSGRNRVMITGLFTSDPNIVKYRVFWNGWQDSTEASVKRTSGVDTAKIIISNLPEGQMSFEIKTYDIAGNSSIGVYETASVFGDLYQSSIVNRGIEDASMQEDGSALISWADVNSAAGVLNMEITYPDSNDVIHDTLINAKITGQTTELPAYKLGSPFSYKTAYLPAPNSIDTFSTSFQSHTVKADVTKLYLSNTGPNFQHASFDGRWGVLAAPWITNAAAMNKDGGVNGGYTSDSRWGSAGMINWETWGNTPVTDGKIYQPTNLPLPAGNYTITFHYYSEIQSNSSVYCIVAAGNSGIPSLINISSSLGYTLLYNGAPVGKTSPNLDEVRSFSFTLASPQIVSIGFLGNLVGNGNPGNYFVIEYIKLIQN
ncbi:DUF4998 domain-containing protein [Arachidicoccus sp.]|uniref:DUF4998 domain-containing protein n=1 Tax=Arachidicoccus sp. TaxID=1872624 RepID=UPI003D21CB1C